MEPQRGLLILPCESLQLPRIERWWRAKNESRHEPTSSRNDAAVHEGFFPWLFWKESTNLVAFGRWPCLEVWPDAEHVLQIKQLVLLQTGSGMTFSSHRIMTNKN